MKIDFHTKYNEKEHINLWNNAMLHNLDALVMTGLPENKTIEYHKLTIFPAQEVEWRAALEIPTYRSKRDLNKDKKQGEKTEVYQGKSLVILPEGLPQIKSESPIPLYDLLELVSRLHGVTIALQDDSNWPTTNYPFDALRIRPYNSHDIHSELPFTGQNFSRVAVSGSGASESYQLENGAFTVYGTQIKTQNELINAIKKRASTKLYASKGNEIIPIEKTVSPLEVIIDPKIISDFLKR